jgi:large subunit ribosomal protein L10
MMKRPEKEQMVEELGQLFEEANNIFVTDYLGLNVAQVTEFRKNLRENNVKFRVAKNTLLSLAAKNKGYDNLVDHFEGPTAIAFGVDDPTVPAKAIYDFHKKHGKPETKIFIADGVAYTADQLKSLAELPSKDELIAKIVGTIGAPLTNLVGTLDGLIRGLCVTIDQIAQQKGN